VRIINVIIVWSAHRLDLKLLATQTVTTVIALVIKQVREKFSFALVNLFMWNNKIELLPHVLRYTCGAKENKRECVMKKDSAEMNKRGQMKEYDMRCYVPS
jgi:hypothetical protein